MDNSKAENDEDGDEVSKVDYNTTLDSYVIKDIPKWAIKASDISGPDVFSQSMPPDNVSTIELVNVISVPQLSNSKIDTNPSTSSSSLSVEEQTMYQRRGDKEDTVANQNNLNLQTLQNQTLNQYQVVYF